MDTAGLVDKLCAEIARTGTAAVWAKAHGISTQYVADVVAGRRAPGAKIISALGYEKVVTYRKTWGLDEVVAEPRASKTKADVFPEFGVKSDKPARGKGKR